MDSSIANLLGWYGTLAILLAYGLVRFEIISPTNLSYQLLNGTGAVGIVIVSFNKKAYPPAVLNVFWAGIAVIAIVRILL